MTKLVYRKLTGEVVMMGSTVENKVLTTVEVPDDPRMKQGYLMKYKNGVVEFEKSWWMINEELAEKRKTDFAKSLADLQSAKSVDEIKPLLLKLLQNNP